MKKLLLLSFALCSISLRAQVPDICSVFYSVSGNTAYISSLGIPNSSTLVPILIPPGANGMALGPPFGFVGPNPTLWTVIGGEFWYFNGATFLNSNHTAGANAISPGGSKNFLYNISPSGQIYKYDGTANASALVAFSNTTSVVLDLVGDDQDNFYVLSLQNPAGLFVYNTSGVQTCSYSISGITSPTLGDGLAIIGNTVTVETPNGYYVGLISGGSVSFTSTSNSFANASDFANCPRVTTFTADITASPSATITCLIPTISLIAGTASSSVSISSYSWSGPGITGSAISPTAQVFIPGTYTCILTSCEGATTAATFNVITPPILVLVNASASDTSICSGGTSTLFASGASTYTWFPPGLTGSSVTVSPNVNTSYTVIGTNTNGCTSSDTVNVFVIFSPSISAVANPTSLCAGGSSSLTANGSSNYTWMPGNQQGTVVVVNPGSSTIYTVSSELNGCISTATTSVLNPASPTLISSGYTLSCTNPTVLLLVALGSVNDTISWSGPGIIPPNNSTSFTTNVQGTYTLIVTDTLANCVSIDSVKIVNQINPLSLSIVPSASQICYPGGAAVNMLVSTPGFCTWLPAVAINTLSGPLVTVSPSVSTVYTVSAVLGVCAGSSTINIAVVNNPTVLNTVGNLTVCAGKTSTLTASGTPNYTWTPGNLTGASVTLSPLVTTVYKVTGDTANCFASDSLTITVLPVPALSPGGWPVLMCNGNTANLSAGGAVSYTWQPGGANSPSLSVTPSVTTAYTVTGTNSFACTSSSVVTINVLQGPVISATSSSSIICPGDSVSLSASGAGSFTWNPGGITGSLITVSPAFTTFYSVMASDTACSTSFPLTVSVSPCAAPVFGITNAASRPLPESPDLYRIDFTVTAVNDGNRALSQVQLQDDFKSAFPAPSTYTIISPPQITSKNSSLVTNPFYNGVSDIELTNIANSVLLPNKRDTLVFGLLLEPKGYYGRSANSVLGIARYQGGFSVRDSSNNGFVWDSDGDGDPTNNNVPTFIDIDFINLFIPEGFSPNGDDRYDRFEIKGLYGRPIKLTVFNRWGNKVYEKTNYDNSWDGRSNTGGVTFGTGKLPQSTYYYIIQFLDGRKETKTGFVVLEY